LTVRGATHRGDGLGNLSGLKITRDQHLLVTSPVTTKVTEIG
jgi:hypothetical protein